MTHVEVVRRRPPTTSVRRTRTRVGTFTVAVTSAALRHFVGFVAATANAFSGRQTLWPASSAVVARLVSWPRESKPTPTYPSSAPGSAPWRSTSARQSVSPSQRTVTARPAIVEAIRLASTSSELWCCGFVQGRSGESAIGAVSARARRRAARASASAASDAHRAARGHLTVSVPCIPWAAWYLTLQT